MRGVGSGGTTRSGASATFRDPLTDTGYNTRLELEQGRKEFYAESSVDAMAAQKLEELGRYRKAAEEAATERKSQSAKTAKR